MDFKKFTTAGIARSTSTPSASSLSSPAKKSLSVSLIKPEFTKPSFPNDEHLPIRLVLCFDGTGDTVKGSFSAVSGETVGTKDSIGTIWDLTKGGPVVDKDGKKFFQHVQYFEGVGTVGVSPDVGLITRTTALFDAATGHGYLDILHAGYRVCCEQLQPRDGVEHQIFIFGFSRGAFISRALASFLQTVGILKEEFLKTEKIFDEKFKELLARYSKITSPGYSIVPPVSIWGKKTDPVPAADGLLPSCNPSPRVRLIGAFDTVKTVIPIPLSNLLSSGLANLDFKMDAPKIVDHFRHALALNEARPLFNPDLWKSDANSADSSYLEAWFFGYHHDIGGGDAVQGLALWPLQWILNAAIENGLVLDPTVEPYDVLFSGKDNVIETPHDIAMKMYDMIRHHTTTKLWGLRLNEPFSLMSPQPRSYFQYLTTPPYIKFVRPKVFLHPSAYLVFDVSSSFRIQVYQWKYFRTFLNDRFKAIPNVENPWWERQAIESILHKSGGVDKLNVMVIGRPGTGKSEMVERIFGKPPESILKKFGVAKAVEIPENKRVSIRYSDGFGQGGNDSRTAIQNFFDEQAATTDINSRVHIIWYFVDCMQKSFTTGERAFFKMDFGSLPVLVVLQNEDKLKESIREDEIHLKEDGSSVATDLEILNSFNSTVDALKSQLTDLPVQKYVHARNSSETPKNLLNETAISLEDEAIHIAQIKAQRIEVKPKIALATEESVRAFTIWHLNKDHGESHTFYPYLKSPKTPLSSLLLKPILDTFNMGFPGDEELIKSRISKPWISLDSHTTGLEDETIPGYLILMCMVDAVVVMTYALSHRVKQGYGGFLGGTSENTSQSVLTKGELEKACDWFTNVKSNKQEQLHKMIQDLLDDEGQPKGNDSITNLQMKIIETVELFSDHAECASTGILASAADWWRVKK